MDLNDKVRMIAEGEFEVQAKLTVDDITDICRRLRGAESERDYSKLEISSLRREYLSSFKISMEKIISLEAELEAIKKQESVVHISRGGTVTYAIDYEGTLNGEFYAKPVYQHSFTVDGHTFYADNEVDILYLERKFGVGGVPTLKAVDNTEYVCCGNPVMDNGYVCCGQYEPK